ncbi:cytochrome P450 [Amniculicola lignicola CBS 123094]|uniref:Cytochrome P450 n=1 Tax=Amniculicola lignicola CBS 123094 TaxID=1392246 RepID=A0A6A5WSD1_9PLEO|nr:cytochrome P450 [Amniculicola lignicola CBS 123094]
MAVLNMLTAESAFLVIPSLVLLILITQTLTSWTRLRHIPGPHTAKFSNLARFLWVKSNRAHEIHTQLHRKYGPVVRFGPNMVAVADPAEIGHIYGFGKTGAWRKSDFYRALLMKPTGKPMPGIFATQDETIHKALKRPISGAYSMSTLVSFEPYVDATMRVFCDQLQTRFAETKAVADFGMWLQMFAFDVIGQLTFSKRLGFLERGEDVDNVMARLWGMFRQTSLASQMPWIDPLWTNNPLKRWMRSKGTSPGAAFAMERIAERRALMAQSGKDDWGVKERDFLSRFLEIEAKENGGVPPYAVSVWASSNITAGSDTTGILLRTIFYNLLQHPQTMDKLVAELNTAAEKGELDELASWKQTRELPYLAACITEAGRLHPPFGLPYERVVPPEGATVSGTWLPGGTIVGMSAWATHRHRPLFGDDCDDWVPERWLRCSPEHRRKMENGLLTFGAGHRSCLGKHVAYLEVYKVVPTLLRKFKFELVRDAHHAPTWTVENRWFIMQHGFFVRLSPKLASGDVDHTR